MGLEDPLAFGRSPLLGAPAFGGFHAQKRNLFLGWCRRRLGVGVELQDVFPEAEGRHAHDHLTKSRSRNLRSPAKSE